MHYLWSLIHKFKLYEKAPKNCSWGNMLFQIFYFATNFYQCSCCFLAITAINNSMGTHRKDARIFCVMLCEAHGRIKHFPLILQKEQHSRKEICGFICAWKKKALYNLHLWCLQKIILQQFMINKRLSIHLFVLPSL